MLLVACLSPNQKIVKKSGSKKGIFAIITTEKGVMLAKLEYEKAPLTVANFIGLAQGIIPNSIKKVGEPFYDGLKFYKVFKGFMLIAGCPKNDGTGHPGYWFMDEFHPDLKHDSPGVLSMQCSNGPNTNGSQFAITMRASITLDNKNTVFGKVISGIDLLKEIQQGEKIVKIEIVKIGRKANAFDPIKVFDKNGFKNMKKIENGK
jgi:peptidyl-prolyl cis-trans isomerase A (cyclophilin A)